ncbi:hypothetical protein FACS1894164_21250 [Spirochaetia bacterium]|nr:hypothetical protein FACS1894164_21250 [Spirochaetia bacterium]
MCVSAERIDGAIGISQTGIDYGSVDNAPVHIIFMILTHPDECDASLRLLRSLALVLSAPDIVSAMLNDQKPEAIYELLSKTYKA